MSPAFILPFRKTVDAALFDQTIEATCDDELNAELVITSLAISKWYTWSAHCDEFTGASL